MGPDDFQQYLSDVLARLQGIEDAVGAPAEPALVPPPATVTVLAPTDPMPLVVAIVLGGVAVALALVALLVTRQTHVLLKALRTGVAPADPHLEQRRAFATLLRRYSELLGVEAVTGRVPGAGDTSLSIRGRLENALTTLREPGAAELLAEVGDARAAVPELPDEHRAAANGIIAMNVEWSIDRWVAGPRAWLADSRERARLEQLTERGQGRTAA